MNNHNSKTAQSNLSTGRIATPHGREWTRLLRVLAARCRRDQSLSC